MAGSSHLGGRAACAVRRKVIVSSQNRVHLVSGLQGVMRTCSSLCAKADARTLRTQGLGLVATINLTVLGRSRSSSPEQICPCTLVMGAVSAPSSFFRAPVFWEWWKTSAEPVRPPPPDPFLRGGVPTTAITSPRSSLGGEQTLWRGHQNPSLMDVGAPRQEAWRNYGR